jgi:hypothetical protein
MSSGTERLRHLPYRCFPLDALGVRIIKSSSPVVQGRRISRRLLTLLSVRYNNSRMLHSMLRSGAFSKSERTRILKLTIAGPVAHRGGEPKYTMTASRSSLFTPFSDTLGCHPRWAARWYLN